jgi:hypothetical protein
MCPHLDTCRLIIASAASMTVVDLPEILRAAQQTRITTSEAPWNTHEGFTMDIFSVLAGLGNQEALLKRVSDSPTMGRSGQSPKILVAESPDHEGKQGTGGVDVDAFFLSVLFCLS